MTESSETGPSSANNRAASGDTGGPGTRLVVLVSALSVLALVALGVLTWLWLDARGQVEEHEERAADLEQARDAAYDLAVDMSTYSHQSLDADFAWYEQDTTEHFREIFKIEDTKATAREFKIQRKGDVPRIAAQYNEDGTVTALAFIDAAFKVGDEEPELALSRLELTMSERDGEWLAYDAHLHNPGTPAVSSQ